LSSGGFNKKTATVIVVEYGAAARAMTLRLKIFTLGLILAVAATTQCFARCDVSALLAPSAPVSDHCASHRQQHHHSTQPCVHQHEQLFSPEQGVDIAVNGLMHAVFAASPAISLPVNSVSGVCIARRAPVFPPGNKLYVSLSSLRI
jgi:hypothetical protein